MEVIGAADTVVDRPSRVSEPRRGRALLARLCKPSLSDLFFAFLVICVLWVNPSGGSYVLRDADTAFHIRIGQYILGSGAVPHHDVFSFSKPGGTWYAWEWLAEIILALVFNLAGWKGIVLLAGVLISLYNSALLKYMIWKGSNGLMALIVLALAVDAASVHYYARPHLFTLLFLSVAIWILEYNRRNGGKRVWLLVPLIGIWANMHGGFAMFFALLALRVLGCFAESCVWPDSRQERRREALTLIATGAACGVASLANPYGIHLHSHVFEYLDSKWVLSHVSEALSPTFRSTAMYDFLILLFTGLASVEASIRNKRIVEPLWIIFLAYCSLVSARHIPLYVLVAAPIISVELSSWWYAMTADRSKRSVFGILHDVSHAFSVRLTGTSLFVPAFIAVLALCPGLKWPTSFPDGDVPVRFIERHSELLANARLFTSDQNAAYLIFRNQPHQRVFMDTRHNYYGPAIGADYLAMNGGGPKWRKLLNDNRIDVILCSVTAPLASLVQASSDWRVLDRDGRNILAAREGKGLGPKQQPERALHARM